MLCGPVVQSRDTTYKNLKSGTVAFIQHYEGILKAPLEVEGLLLHIWFQYVISGLNMHATGGFISTKGTLQKTYLIKFTVLIHREVQVMTKVRFS